MNLGESLPVGLKVEGFSTGRVIFGGALELTTRVNKPGRESIVCNNKTVHNICSCV